MGSPSTSIIALPKEKAIQINLVQGKMLSISSLFLTSQNPNLLSLDFYKP